MNFSGRNKGYILLWRKLLKFIMDDVGFAAAAAVVFLENQESLIIIIHLKTIKTTRSYKFNGWYYFPTAQQAGGSVPHITIR